MIFFTGRTPRSGDSRYLNLHTGWKSAFSPHRGELLHRFTWNLAQPSGMWVRLAVQNFTPISARWWEHGPQNGKNFYFLVKSRLAGWSPWSISTIVRSFYMPNYPLMLHIWRDLLHELRNYCWETVLRSLKPNFSVHPVGKTMRWIEEWFLTFFTVSICTITVQFGKDCFMRAGCRCENMVFICLFFICHALSLARCSFEGDIIWTGIVSSFICGFTCGFQSFFATDHSFRCTT